MSIPFVDLRQEYRSLQAELRVVLDDCFQTGVFILGENVTAFEEEFAAYCRVPFAVGVGSGTEALHLSLRACGVSREHEVITAPNTAAPTALAIASTGARVVFVDIDPRTYTLDPDKLEDAITPATRAIVPVHLYGHPVDMEPIMTIALRHNLYVIEDACQAHGSEYKGLRVGSIGHLGCFSFYPTKNLGAYGDAGIIITDDQTLRDRLRLLRNLGQTDRYYHVIKSYNSRLDEIQAAVLRLKLRYLDAWNEKRRQLAKTYAELLSRAKVVLPEEALYAKHVYHLYVVRVSKRDDLASYLLQKGIQTLIHYPIPLHLQEAFRDLGYRKGAFPQAEQIAQEILSLPLHPFLERESVALIVKMIIEFQSS